MRVCKLCKKVSMPSQCCFAVCLILMLLFLAGPAAWSQTTFGSISGTVTDPSGAVIPDAQLALTNINTNAKRVTVTNADGIYEFVNLPPAEYRIDVTKGGFKHFRRSPVVVQVQQKYRIDVKLQVGSTTQTIRVTSATPLLQPESSSLGQVISGKHVTSMPLNGRNVYNLMILVPSVVPQGSTTASTVTVNSAAWNNYQIDGTFAGQSAVYVDGAPVNQTLHNDVALIPSQDMIQEFKVQTNNLGPEWGFFAGGVMNLTTKSGTNQIHGEAYEFVRNKVLNANDFFSNAGGLAEPPLTQNQFGANAGGPVYIPHIYDGRNKTFWFFGWESYRLRQGQTFLTTVPTAAERSGDFSNLRDASGSLIPIFNPFSVCGELGNPPCPTGPSGQPVYTRSQFSGNVIPPTLIGQAATKMESLWPTPNLPGQPFTNVNNFIANASAGGNEDNVTTRIDQTVSDRQHVFGRFIYWKATNLPINPLGTGVCVDHCYNSYTAKDVVIDDTYSFSPSTVGNFNVSYLRFNYDRTPLSTGFDLTSLGWPSILNSEIPPTVRTIPTPDVLGEASEIFSTQGQSVIHGLMDVWDFAPSVTKIVGTHTLQFGGEVRVNRYNYGQTQTASGYFSFDNGFTASAPFGGSGGFGFASFLLGTPSSGSAQLPAFVAAQQIYRALYFGDTWRLTHKLTLNLGLRYDQLGPWSERFNRLSFFDGSAPSTLTVPGLSLHGQFGLVDSSLRPSRNNIDLDPDQFAPRVGFAYQLTRNTVLRAGYGIFWIPNDADNSGLPNNDSLNGVTTPVITSINGGLSPYNTLNNPFPNGVLPPTGRPAKPDEFCLNLGGCAAFVPNDRYGYIQQWNFDLQRQLPAGIFVDVAYAGSKGTHLPFSQFANQLPDQDLSLGSALLNQVANPFLGLITGGPLSTPTIAAGQLLRPYPQYNNFSITSSGFGTSIYHSLQLKMQKRLRGGGTLLLAYTNAKFISDVDDLTSWLEGPTGGIGGIQDWNNLRAARTLSSDDIPQRFVASYVIDLPFGHGQKFLSGVKGPASKFISGWGLGGITTFQSGFPLKFSTSRNQTGSFGGGSLPNVLCGNQSMSGNAVSKLQQWFKTACFGQPAPFTFGNEPRVDPRLRQQGINNFDVALIKNTQFGPEDKLGLQFRAEFFNLFNRPEFGPPDTTLGTAQFGVVSSQVNDPRLIQFALRFTF